MIRSEKEAKKNREAAAANKRRIGFKLPINDSDLEDIHYYESKGGDSRDIKE